MRNKIMRFCIYRIGKRHVQCVLLVKRMRQAILFCVPLTHCSLMAGSSLYSGHFEPRAFTSFSNTLSYTYSFYAPVTYSVCERACIVALTQWEQWRINHACIVRVGNEQYVCGFVEPVHPDCILCKRFSCCSKEIHPVFVGGVVDFFY